MEMNRITKGKWMIDNNDKDSVISIGSDGYRNQICRVPDQGMGRPPEIWEADSNLIILAGNLAQLHSPETWQLKLEQFDKMTAKVDKQISELKARKEQLLKDYLTGPEEMRNMIAAQNMEITMKIKFLQSISVETLK